MVASNFVSCSSKISEADALNLETTPMQTVDDVFAVRSTNGKLKMRLEAEVMEHYETKTEDMDVFPKGISVFAYSDDGLLESIVIGQNRKYILIAMSRFILLTDLCKGMECAPMIV